MRVRGNVARTCVPRPWEQRASMAWRGGGLVAWRRDSGDVTRHVATPWRLGGGEPESGRPAGPPFPYERKDETKKQKKRTKKNLAIE